MGFDYFVGELRCASCGRVSAADGKTDMQTKIRDDAELAYLGVGAIVDAGARNLRDSDYLELRPPVGGECRILQTWDCAFCAAPSNWAQIVIRDGEIREVLSVAMNREILASANYIDEYDGLVLAAEMTGRPSSELGGPALLDALRGLAN
jgi:hypothetical protein